MDDQPTLPFQPHSATSRAAAEEAEPAAGTQRAKVLAYIRECGFHGATDEEIQTALQMNPSTQRPRRVELFRAMLIAKAGTRPTKSGRAAQVWRAIFERF